MIDGPFTASVFCELSVDVFPSDDVVTPGDAVTPEALFIDVAGVTPEVVWLPPHAVNDNENTADSKAKIHFRGIKYPFLSKLTILVLCNTTNLI